MSEDYIIKMYQEGASITELAKHFHCRRAKISGILRNGGVVVGNRQNAPRMNQDFFERIDSEEKAYWLGFMYADGYVESKKYGIELSLSRIDFEHLEKFKRDIEWSGNVADRGYRARVYFRNKKMHADLVRCGCTPRKSLTLTFPEVDIVPEHLRLSFIRGYFDGDGYLGVDDRGARPYPRIGFCGTDSFLLAVQSVLGIEYKIKKDSRSECRSFELSHGRAELVLDAIYKNSSIHLERKYNLYNELKKCRPRQ